MSVLWRDATKAARHATADAHGSLLLQAVKLLQMLLFASFAAALVCFIQPCTTMFHDMLTVSSLS